MRAQVVDLHTDQHSRVDYGPELEVAELALVHVRCLVYDSLADGQFAEDVIVDRVRGVRIAVDVDHSGVRRLGTVDYNRAARRLVVRCQYMCVVNCWTLLCDNLAVECLGQEVQVEGPRPGFGVEKDQGAIPTDLRSEAVRSPSQSLDEDCL